MAFSIKIVEENEGGTHSGSDVKWWDKDELRKKYNFREQINEGYLDYVLTVDKKLFQEIIEDQEKYRGKGLYAFEGWVKQNNETYEYLQYRLSKMKNDDKCTICIYEWESGM